MTYALGIDLGTTYTAAAVARGGRAEVVALGYRATSVPTVVFLAEDGRFLVGDAAERRAGSEPDRVAREFKRRVGDPTPLLLGGSPIAVDRCLAEVLRWVVATVGETEGGRPSAVTVTHPANWREFKQDVLGEALRMAEIPQARMLAEPVAAATWYAQAERLAPGQAIAVYDLGGGTFDAAVLRRRPDGTFETLGRTEGIDRLGGVDVDQALIGHVLRTVGRPHMDVADEDPATAMAMAQLREACVEAKEALSSETSVTIPVWLPGLHHKVLVHRTELEDLVGPMLRPTVDALARVVTSAGLRPDDLHAVLLVGGSSRIPLIARNLSAAFGRPIAVDAHPKHPVALGAALDADAHPVEPPVAAAPPRAFAMAAPAPPLAAATAPSAPAWSTASGPGSGAPTRPVPPPPPLPPRPPTGQRTAWAISLGVTLLVLAVSLFMVLRSGGEGDPQETSASDDSPTTIEREAEGLDPDVTESAEGDTTLPPAQVDLFADPGPAFDSFRTIYGEAPPRVWDITIHDTWASIQVQVPDKPTYSDEYQFEDGALTGPEPAFIPPEPETFEQELFDLAEVDPAIIPGLFAQACQGDGVVPSHVIIKRDLTFNPDEGVIIRVYTSNDDRGTGGFVEFRLDGTEVDRACE